MSQALGGRTASGCIAWFLLVIGIVAGPARAESPQATSARLQAELAAGEFSAALRSAEELDGAARDAALAEIAAAQARAGSPRAAASAVAVMRDDRLRAGTLNHLAYRNLGESRTAFDGPTAGAGGGVQPDFDTLIDLITNTIRQQDWVDNGGTIGHIKAHDGGVYVDASGEVKPIENAAELVRLGALRRDAARAAPPGRARQTSALRKISLTRLEREVQLRRALGRPLDEEMPTLAGLRRVTHVFIYPESGDVVLAGPAGDWYLGRENRRLSVEDDRPVVLLADVITLLHREFDVGGPFGCSIDPTPDGLRRVQAFVESTRQTPLSSGGLTKWTRELRDQLGRQNVRVYGINPQSRVARTLVEADYRMKLVGIDLEDGTLHVPSYFDIVRASGQEPPSMGLLRWWFTVNYDALFTSPTRDVYELRGQGVRLQSENEFLSARGERTATGTSDSLNRQFADNFTQYYAEIAQKYPLYADLQNIFDLALVSAVLKNEGVYDRIGWHRLGFADERAVAGDRGVAPATVESAANGTALSKSRVMAVISGGVTVDCSAIARPSTVRVDDRGRLTKERQSAAPTSLPTHAWWWD